MTAAVTPARALLHALDPVTWARDALGFVADPWQARAMRSSHLHVVVNCSRQAGKTRMATVLALHHALFRPSALVLIMAPSLRQSSEDFRTFTGDLDRLDPRPATTEESKTAIAFANGSRVVALPASDATTRGFASCTLLIEDEASRVPDDVHAAMRPALAVSRGRIFLLSTPNGQRGHFWDAWTNGEPAERIRVTAHDVPRIAPTFLASERRVLGPRMFAQEYEATFTDADGALFSADVIARAFRADVLPLDLDLGPETGE